MGDDVLDDGRYENYVQNLDRAIALARGWVNSARANSSCAALDCDGDVEAAERQLAVLLKRKDDLAHRPVGAPTVPHYEANGRLTWLPADTAPDPSRGLPDARPYVAPRWRKPAIIGVGVAAVAIAVAAVAMAGGGGSDTPAVVSVPASAATEVVTYCGQTTTLAATFTPGAAIDAATVSQQVATTVAFQPADPAQFSAADRRTAQQCTATLQQTAAAFQPAPAATTGVVPEDEGTDDGTYDTTTSTTTTSTTTTTTTVFEGDQPCEPQPDCTTLPPLAEDTVDPTPA